MSPVTRTQTTLQNELKHLKLIEAGPKSTFMEAKVALASKYGVGSDAGPLL